MNKAILSLGFAFLLATSVFAAEEVGNKICPISGHEVGGMGEIVKHEHNGKIYNLCCSMCKKDFNKDPEAFSKKADEEVAGAKSADSHEGHNH